MYQLQIVDGPIFRSVLRRICEHFGTHRKAAKALGIKQPTFTRLLNGTVTGRISFNTYRGIQGVLRDKIRNADLIEQFELSVLTRDGWHVQQRYKTWLYGEINRLARVLTIFLELWEHEDYRELFEKFIERFTGWRNLPPQQERRLWVALLRTVEPLGAAIETWGMEQSWQEIHKADRLSAFLRHSLNREVIMLERDPYYARLNKCSPPSSYLDALAGEDTVLDRDEIEYLKKSGVRDLE